MNWCFVVQMSWRKPGEFNPTDSVNRVMEKRCEFGDPIEIASSHDPYEIIHVHH